MTRPHVTSDRRPVLIEDEPQAAVAPVDIARTGSALAALPTTSLTTHAPADKRRRFPMKESQDGDR